MARRGPGQRHPHRCDRNRDRQHLHLDGDSSAEAATDSCGLLERSDLRLTTLVGSMPDTRFRFFIDRGGTFTDVIGVDPNTGEQRSIKVLSSDEAPLVGMRQVLGLAPTDPMPPCSIRMGTTLATNALLERRGVDCLLLISRGFRDLLEIGTQARPHIFELNIDKPKVLQRAVVEVLNAIYEADFLGFPMAFDRGAVNIKRWML